jgi:CBS domain-containing protein
MSLERFCRKPVVTARPEDPVSDVAFTMLAQHVGAVVVVDGERRPIGIVTDRDLALRVLAERRDPRTPVRDAMSVGALCAEPGMEIEAAVWKMRERGVRRLPIVDGSGRLAGMVTLDDLHVLLSGEMAAAAYVVQHDRGP